MNQYQRHMSPFPGLERWSHQVQLPQSAINLHVYDTGGGEDGGTPILLLHGLGDEADTWRHVLLALGPGRRAIAPDLPGFGRSDQGKYPYSIPFFAGIMLELLDMFSISHVVLVGHSTGAAVAHEFAVEHPERVEKLVLIGGSLVSKETPLNLGLFLFLVPGLGEWSYNRLRRDSQEAYCTLEAYYNRLEDLPQADRDFLFQRVNERVWSDGQRRGFLSTLRSLARWMPAQQKNWRAACAVGPYRPLYYGVKTTGSTRSKTLMRWSICCLLLGWNWFQEQGTISSKRNQALW